MSSKDAPRVLQMVTTRYRCRCGARLETEWARTIHRQLWCPYGAGGRSDHDREVSK